MNSTCIYLLAQTPPSGVPVSPVSPAAQLFPFALMIAVVAFMLLSARSNKKREKREREQMFAGLSKNDRVQTIGGVIGTIMFVKDNEVVLKVDETTNTKMTFIKSAIQRVISDNGPSGTEKA
jgi:preprotein translocase subunit YajC